MTIAKQQSAGGGDVASTLAACHKCRTTAPILCSQHRAEGGRCRDLRNGNIARKVTSVSQPVESRDKDVSSSAQHALRSPVGEAPDRSSRHVVAGSCHLSYKYRRARQSLPTRSLAGVMHDRLEADDRKFMFTSRRTGV